MLVGLLSVRHRYGCSDCTEVSEVHRVMHSGVLFASDARSAGTDLLSSHSDEALRDSESEWVLSSQIKQLTEKISNILTIFQLIARGKVSRPLG